MRNVIVLVALAMVLGAPAASAETLHAAYHRAEPPFARDPSLCGEGPGGGYVGYVGARRVCADIAVNSLKSVLAPSGDRIDRVVLLTSRPNAKTLYRVGPDRAVILPLASFDRPDGRPLTVTGQRDAAGEHLVWFKGLDLIDTICDPRRVIDRRACREGRTSTAPDADAAFDGRYELTSLALVEEAEFMRALDRLPDAMTGVTRRGPRSYCVRLRAVRGVILSDLAFEDCWIAAMTVVNSSNVALTDARIHGSTFGMLAIGTKGSERQAHSFRISGTRWIQSPGAYRPDAAPCPAPHLDLACVVDVWDDLPWGVTHHHIWRPLNGALFSGHNIAGNVLIEDNLLERAFNGIRIMSRRAGTGRNVEIRGNRFRFVRDNAIEPENRAEGWVVKHNVFENVHAWISTDGVAGGSMYVFGNRGWYDPGRLPGQDCRDDVDWARSPHFTGLAGDAGRYLLIDTSYDPTSVTCRGHRRGVVLKTGHKRKSDLLYFRRISIFNNSWRTRSPLFSARHASLLSHFNNAIAFTGCGLRGALHCRQVPAPVWACPSKPEGDAEGVGMRRYWTADGAALVADCFTFTPGGTGPAAGTGGIGDLAHAFCRDAYNRGFDGAPYGRGRCVPVVRTPLFAEAQGGDLRLAETIDGCRPRLAEGAVIAACDSAGPTVGALQEGGQLFDMDIPGAGYLGDRFEP